VSKRVFVFGSNLAGRHGKGAALHALQNHGAVYGQGQGPQGNSYAIPTKDRYLRTLPIDYIKTKIEEFIDYANDNFGLDFDVTPIGCGLAGYKQEEIYPFFKEYGVPNNVYFTKDWTVIE